VLFARLLKPDKGVHVLLQASRQVQSALPPVIAADSSEAGDYTRRLKSTSDDCVGFVGCVYGSDLQQLFANCSGLGTSSPTSPL